MTSKEIRTKGIRAPGYSQCGDDLTAVSENLGIIAGALVEIAAQLAELNDLLYKTNLNGSPSEYIGVR